MNLKWLKFSAIVLIAIITLAVIIPMAITHATNQGTIDVSVISVAGAMIAGIVTSKKEEIAK